jgi:hypothetical protein
MALPVTFASLSTVTLSQLDQNFNALGALTPIPCAVTGTNTLALAPAANTPTVAVLANYMQFTGVAANTNSGAVTANVNSLGPLNVYVDTPSGPVAVSSGQIVQNTLFTLMYDSTLNTGAGGFHLLSAVVVGSFLPLGGGTLSGALVGTTITLSGPIKSAGATISGTSTLASVNASGNITGSGLIGTSATVTTSTVSGLGKLGSYQVASGAVITRMLMASVSLAYGAVAANSSSDQTMTVAGCSIGDVVISSPPSAPTVGLAFNAFVSGANIVTIRMLNVTSVTLVPPSGTYAAAVIGNT